MQSLRQWLAIAVLGSSVAYAMFASPDERHVSTFLGRAVRVAESDLKVVKRVEPVPPRRALDRGTQGEVVVEALIDIKGSVAEVKVLKGLPDGLTQATVSAVRQWQFEPYLEWGHPVPVLSPVTINFRVSGPPAEAAASQSVVQTRLGPTLHIDDPKYAPKVLKLVNPHYPETARGAGTTGLVRMDVLIDTRGNVVDVKVLSGAPNGLTEAAVTAVRQWKFKPFARDGKAWPVLTPVRVNFKL